MAPALAAMVAGCFQSTPRPVPSAQDIAQDHPGARLYQICCAACHMPDGQGAKGVGPPLAGSAWVQGPEERLVRIVLHGIRGPLSVNDYEYNLEMPPMGFFADEDIAAILTFVRDRWHNSAPPITPQTVTRVRAQTADRGDSWTAEELLVLP